MFSGSFDCLATSLLLAAIFTIMIIIPPWVPMAGPRSAWSKVVKFGTHWGQSPGPIHQVSCLILGHSIYTNGSKLECRVQRLYRFSAISGFIKKLIKPEHFSQVTNYAQSSPDFAHMIFRPSLTKVIENNFDLHNRLSMRANQIQQKSCQTGSEVISQQFFEEVTPNLVGQLRTLF